MQRIANPYYVFKRRVGSTPTLSAIFLILFTSQANAYESLIKELKQYVPVEIDTETCERKQSYDGFYQPTSNKIELCLLNIKKYWDNDHRTVINNVLNHEAVHLAQDCKAGVDNNILSVIDYSKANVSKKIKERYSKEDHLIEAEAWHYWGMSTIHLVKQHCQRR